MQLINDILCFVDLFYTWNLTCSATECLFIPAVPDVKVLLMDEALLSAWLPSAPTMEPERLDRGVLRQI